MIKRFLRSRGLRRFLKMRVAVASLIVICFYLLIGVSVSLFGLLSEDDVIRRVGMLNEPGFGIQELPEKRLEYAEQKVSRVRQSLYRENPQAALDEISYGVLDVADLPLESIRAHVERADKIYDKFTGVGNLNENPQYIGTLEEYEAIVEELYPPPTGSEAWLRKLEMLLGTDQQGRSIFYRAVYAIKVALKIATITALIGVGIGSLLGLMAAFLGGWVDHIITWLFTTFSSIPSIVLLVVIAYAFMEADLGYERIDELIPVYLALGATFWIGPCRLMRGETFKLKEQEFVQAATAIGFGRMRIMLRHVLPNAAHLVLINFSLLFVAAIKTEVILTYLNLGVKNQPSWGVMISQSSDEVVNGFFWQIGAATVFMFVLVLAFNILSDALQDVFDPKHS